MDNEKRRGGSGDRIRKYKSTRTMEYDRNMSKGISENWNWQNRLSTAVAIAATAAAAAAAMAVHIYPFMNDTTTPPKVKAS